MRSFALLLAAVLLPSIPSTPAAPQPLAAQQPIVEVAERPDGLRLEIDGQPFFVKGVNWDYFPIGTTTTYDFWGQPEGFVREAVDREMNLLKAMGGNAIRVYNGIPPEWVRYIWETHGIWTILNHPVGRYGVTVDGRYLPSTDYSDPRVRAMLRGEVEALVRQFEGTPGILMWLLGNENNYGLEWASPETEDLPEGEQYALKARYLYSLMGEIVDAVHALDSSRPVAMANGDLQYFDIIAEEVPNLDIFGSNVYRGISFRDFFERVDETMGIPVLFTEFGADAFNARTFAEDQPAQARYLIGQWREMYEQAAGQGGIGNAIGGATFQWSDGWWKFGQDSRLDIHDTNASWANDAYPHDFEAGQNNMNEEWWGITAKGPTDPSGHYRLYPRAAYYALRDINELDPYDPATTPQRVAEHFAGITAEGAALAARGDAAALAAERGGVARLSALRMDFETYSTGGDFISTPVTRSTTARQRPSFQGFDTKESFFVEAEANPAPNIVANLAVNVLGSVPDNPIDEIFYENVGRRRSVTADGERYDVFDFERVRIYQASLSWDAKLFRVDGFYRSGHYHWGYEGDFFNLYREANYGPNIDIYNGLAPIGFEVQGKRQIDGLKLAFGPQLWWGANPAVLAKYGRNVAGWQVTGVWQEDLQGQSAVASSFAIPVRPTRRATLHLQGELGGFGVDVGGIWAGSTFVDETFQLVEGTPGAYEVLQDQVRPSDAFGAKAKLTLQRGRLNWYGLASSTGIVADGGYDQTQTFTGWRLKDNGSGNQVQVLSGFTWTAGNLQIAPNFMWQRPIVGPVPASAPAPARPRNVLADPFAVRRNRETTAGEILFTWDPTPATWMYTWDNDVQEDAEFAVSAGAVFRRHHTTADASIGILADGRTPFAFPGATPARDLWEVHARIVSKRANGPGLILNTWYGTGEPNGSDERLITRSGADLRVIQGSVRLWAFAKFNDWGPFDYHRDFNLTFPQQWMADLSYTLGPASWFDLPGTRIGLRGTWRSLDQYSPRYCPGFTQGASGQAVCDPLAPGPRGSEWEIRTYLQFGM